MYLAGLTEFAEQATSRTDATFARRFATTTLSPVSDLEIHLAGQRAWYAGSSEVITLDDVETGWELAEAEATLHVERIIDRLPAKERELIEVLAALEPGTRSATNIAKTMGYKSAANAAPFSE